MVALEKEILEDVASLTCHYVGLGWLLSLLVGIMTLPVRTPEEKFRTK